MRERKFKVWDKVHKKWLGTFTLKELSQSTIFIDYGERNIEIVEYTGLKDKKRTKEYPEGQEIYEGDIVKYSAFNEQKELQNYINPIFWEQNFASFSVGNEHSFWALSTCEDVEVIGNIYENPELLKND